jgi:hypothetical protein
MIPRVAKIKDAIEATHSCAACHVASEPVIDIFDGKVAWDGVVETFELVGHPEARRCHAWSYAENGETRYFTVLELPPVNYAASAVRVAITAQPTG